MTQPSSSVIPPPEHELGRLWIESLRDIKSLSDHDLQERTQALTAAGRIKQDASLDYSAAVLQFIRTHGAPHSINFLGTMGCGKSLIARAFAATVGFAYRDADLFHTEAAKRMMSQGFPLQTSDRLPFLNGVREFLSDPGSLSTCSALRHRYRAFLCGGSSSLLDDAFTGDPWADIPQHTGVLFVHICKPQDVALQELDYATKIQPRILQDGKPHYIQVTREQPKILEDQYQLVEQEPVQPWISLVLNTEDYRCREKDQQGKLYLPTQYNLDRMLSDLLAMTGMSRSTHLARNPRL